MNSDPLDPVDQICAKATAALLAGEDGMAGELFDAAIALEEAIRLTTKQGDE